MSCKIFLNDKVLQAAQILIEKEVQKISSKLGHQLQPRVIVVVRPLEVFAVANGQNTDFFSLEQAFSYKPPTRFIGY